MKIVSVDLLIQLSAMKIISISSQNIKPFKLQSGFFFFFLLSLMNMHTDNNHYKSFKSQLSV